MVALIRSLLPGGQTLLKPETIAQMMTNQLPDGQWIRFAMMGEQPRRGPTACRRPSRQPSKFDHPTQSGEFYWGGVAGTQWWISPKPNWPA